MYQQEEAPRGPGRVRGGKPSGDSLGFAGQFTPTPARCQAFLTKKNRCAHTSFPGRARARPDPARVFELARRALKAYVRRYGGPDVVTGVLFEVARSAYALARREANR